MTQPGNLMSSALRCLVPAAFLLAAPIAAVAQRDAIAIENVTLIDVDKEFRAIPRQTIVIDDKFIWRVSGDPISRWDHQDWKLTRIDAAHLYAIPGLFDAHVHYIEPNSFGKMMIAHGVTFVRDLGNATDTIIPIRDQLNKGELLGPEMICTGAIIDGVPPIWPFSEPCDTPEEARAAVQKLYKAGVNQIKVYSKLKPDVYRAAVDEAKKVGLKAVGHIPATVTPDEALAAGQVSVEHLQRFDRIVAELAPEEEDKQPPKDMFSGMSAWARMPRIDESTLVARLKPFADGGMYQCPTIIVMAGIGRLANENAEKDPRLDYVPHDLQAFWAGDMYKGWGKHAAAMVPQMQKMVRAMDKAGVPLVIGTDLANPYVFAGRSVHDEMQLFADAGISTANVLRAATINTATLLGVDKTHGTIEPGKVASIVLLRKNPLDSIANTLEIDSVILHGKYYSRSELDKLMAGVKEAVSSSKPSTSTVKLELPGEPIARGTYTAKFQQFDAGTEDFLITKAADGFRLISHSKPKGGMQPPTVVTVHYSPEMSFVGATYKSLVENPVEVTYTRIGKQIEARAKRGDENLPVQTLDLPDSFSIGAPVNAADFMALPAMKLDVGQKLETTGVGFGYPDWKLSTVPLTVTREPDTEVERAGAMVKARHYKSSMKTPMGVFNSQTWTDDRGVVLKTQLTMPFGTVTSELK
jgi:imidazolonepropionase-like amidohydrolase